MAGLQAGAAGFANTPVSRGVVLVTAAGTVASWVAAGKGIRLENAIVREMAQQLGLQTAWQAIVCLTLLYNFRLLERRVGSGRFGAFVAYSVGCVTLGRVLLAKLAPSLRWVPGPVGLMAACIPPVLCNVVSPTATTFLGLPITEKAYVLFAVAQVWQTTPGLRSRALAAATL